MYKNFKASTPSVRRKNLKNGILADMKKLQRISCAEGVEKGFDLIKENICWKLIILNISKNSVGRNLGKNWLNNHLDSGVPRIKNK